MGPMVLRMFHDECFVRSWQFLTIAVKPHPLPSWRWIASKPTKHGGLRVSALSGLLSQRHRRVHLGSDGSRIAIRPRCALENPIPDQIDLFLFDPVTAGRHGLLICFGQPQYGVYQAVIRIARLDHLAVWMGPRGQRMALQTQIAHQCARLVAVDALCFK